MGPEMNDGIARGPNKKSLLRATDVLELQSQINLPLKVHISTKRTKRFLGNIFYSIVGRYFRQASRHKVTFLRYGKEAETFINYALMLNLLVQIETEQKQKQII